MNRSILSWLLGAVLVSNVTVAAAQKLSPSGKARLDQITGILDSHKVNAEWAKGAIASGDVEAARTEVLALEASLKRAKRILRTIGMWDKKTPEANVVVKDFNAKISYYNAVNNKLKSVKSTPVAVGSAAAGPSGTAPSTTPPGAAAAPPASGNLSSASKHAIKNIDANFGSVNENSPFCEGTFGADKRRAADNFKMSIDAGMSFSRMAAGRVPANERSNPALAARLTKVSKLEACQKKISARLAVLKTEDAAIKKRYFEFKKASGDYRRSIEYVIPLVRFPDDRLRYTPQESQLQKWKDDLAAVHGLCTGQFKGIQNHPNYGHTDITNPEMWCKAAAAKKAIIERLALNYALRSTEQLTKAIQKEAASFEQNEGYIHLSGTIQVKAIYFPKQVKKELGARFAGVLKVAGLSEPEALWGGMDAAITDLWKKIDDSAKQWKSPKKVGGGPAGAVATKSFRSGGNRVIKAYTTRGSWKIHKNGLGIILRRTVPGFVVYKHKDDKKWCRARSFTYTEEYSGGGRYSKPSSVGELGYIRYQACR